MNLLWNCSKESDDTGQGKSIVKHCRPTRNMFVFATVIFYKTANGLNCKCHVTNHSGYTGKLWQHRFADGSKRKCTQSTSDCPELWCEGTCPMSSPEEGKRKRTLVKHPLYYIEILTVYVCKQLKCTANFKRPSMKNNKAKTITSVYTSDSWHAINFEAVYTGRDNATVANPFVLPMRSIASAWSTS